MMKNNRGVFDPGPKSGPEKELKIEICLLLWFMVLLLYAYVW